MDKKRLDYYKKKLTTRREELMKTIARTEEEGRQADDDPTVDLADKAANSYTKEFLFGMTNTDRTILNMIDEALKRIKANEYGHVRELPGRDAAETARSGALGQALHQLPGKDRAGTAVVAARQGAVLRSLPGFRQKQAYGLDPAKLGLQRCCAPTSIPR